MFVRAEYATDSDAGEAAVDAEEAPCTPEDSLEEYGVCSDCKLFIADQRNDVLCVSSVCGACGAFLAAPGGRGTDQYDDLGDISEAENAAANLTEALNPAAKDQQDGCNRKDQVADPTHVQPEFPLLGLIY